MFLGDKLSSKRSATNTSTKSWLPSRQCNSLLYVCENHKCLGGIRFGLTLQCFSNCDSEMVISIFYLILFCHIRRIRKTCKHIIELCAFCTGLSTKNQSPIDMVENWVFLQNRITSKSDRFYRESSIISNSMSKVNDFQALLWGFDHLYEGHICGPHSID